jgi:hypothetical protein
MEKNNTVVRGSIEFRDAVTRLSKGGRTVFVRREKTETPTFVIVPSMNHITVSDLFTSIWPPVMVEDFAQALARAADDELPDVEVFNLEDPNYGVL